MKDIQFKIQLKEKSEKRVQMEFQGIIESPCERIFPLLCPKREEQWIEGWDANIYKLIYSKSGFNEKYCIFQENLSKKALFGEDGPTTWVTVSYQPEDYSLEFLLSFGEMAALSRAIRLTPRGDSSTLCQWTDTITSFNGAWFQSDIDKFEVKLKGFSGFLGVILKYYCETGRMLPMGSLMGNDGAIDIPDEIRSYILSFISG